ncbi:MAG: ABC transporter substrate-binding protein [Ilumatobacteraceae bacterium]
MQAASGAGSGSGSRPSAIRKWGPLAGIVVVVAVVAALVLGGGGNDVADNEATSTSGGPVDSSSDTTAGGPAEWTYPLMFPDAEELGIADTIEWGERCDTDRGRLKVIDSFAPACAAPFSGDNGGATDQGVTADEITIVHYMGPDGDPIINYITDSIKVDDTNAQEEEVVSGFMEYFQTYYELYGRTINYVVYESTGLANDEVTARADAQRIVDEYQPFAVVGGPALTNAFADELAALETLCVSCGGGSPSWFADRDPYVWALDGNAEQKQVHVVEFIGKQLAGKPAVHAGDEFTDTERRFGLVYVESGAESKELADLMVERMTAVGATPAEVIPYQLDPGTLQQTASQVIAKLKAAGVTSVVLATDPVAPKDFTREATAQEYFPEWIVAAATLVDTTAFGRSYDQQQWAHAFGVTSLAVRLNPEVSGYWALYKWFTGTEPAADESIGVYMPAFFLLMSGLQSTGPDLTHENLANTFRSFSTIPAISRPWLTWGDQGIWDTPDYNGIDDATLFWWDAEAVGPDENRKEGTGMMLYVDGGQRYLPGQWPTEDRLFLDDGAVAVYDTAPVGEEPPQYPSPAAG